MRLPSGASVASFFCLVSILVSVSCQKPNIVILFADDLGYGDLGCYGHPTSTTPNIDQLAAEGLRFTDFYASSPVCSPSRAALLTGRYQIRSGVYPNVFFPFSIGGLPHNETTIAEYLKEVGYSTAIVGKWHLGVGANNEYLPTNHGFDYYYGIPYAHDLCPCVTCFYPNVSCFDDCYPLFVSCPLFENMDIIEQPVKFTTLDERMFSTATNYIKKQASEGTPFFLYMAFQHMHHPQYAGEKFTNSSIRGPYGDALNEMDDGVGQIMSALKEAGVEENTFVFFTSDNGPSFLREIRGGNAGLLKCGKGTTYEGGQREPAIAWWPGRIKPGLTREMSSNLDLLPTILKLADVQPKKDVVLDGYDMSSILFDNGKSLREAFYYYPTVPDQSDGVYAVRYKQYKAHFFTEGSPVCSETYPDADCRPDHKQTKEDPPLLYNLFEDPSEVYTLTKDDPEYDTVMKTIMEVKTGFESKMTWGESQMRRGISRKDEPCASKGCFPFPKCCHT